MKYVIARMTKGEMTWKSQYTNPMTLNNAIAFYSEVFDLTNIEEIEDLVDQLNGAENAKGVFYRWHPA